MPQDDSSDDELEAQTFSAAELADQRFAEAQRKGEIIELSSDDEAPTRPRRSGRAPAAPPKRRRVVADSDDDEEYDFDADEEEEEDDDDEEEEEDDDDDGYEVVRAQPASAKTVAQLKDECRSRGLKVGGTKAELVARLANPTYRDRASHRARPRERTTVPSGRGLLSTLQMAQRQLRVGGSSLQSSLSALQHLQTAQRQIAALQAAQREVNYVSLLPDDDYDYDGDY